MLNKIIYAILDSGANISIISSNLANSFNKFKIIYPDSSEFKTINNNDKCLGLIDLPITIGEMRKTQNFHIIDNCNYDILLGLDIIQNFKLSINSELRVNQLTLKNAKEFYEEINSNYSNNVNNLSLNRYCNSINQLEINNSELNSILNKYQGIFLNTNTILEQSIPKCVK